MTEVPPPTPEEVRDAGRFTMMNLARIVSLGLVIVGIAIANDRLPAPYWLGVALAVAGLFGFFYGPRLLVRRWKAIDAESDPE